MSTTRVLMPAEGRRVRFPVTGKLLKDTGEPIVWSSYWHRRFEAGDVVDAPAKAAPAAPAAAKAAVALAPPPPPAAAVVVVKEA